MSDVTYVKEEVVKLNIGGTLFTTSVRTLQREDR